MNCGNHIILTLIRFKWREEVDKDWDDNVGSNSIINIIIFYN